MTPKKAENTERMIVFFIASATSDLFGVSVFHRQISASLPERPDFIPKPPPSQPAHPPEMRV
jgi:hypothetical protein